MVVEWAKVAGTILASVVALFVAVRGFTVQREQAYEANRQQREQAREALREQREQAREAVNEQREQARVALAEQSRRIYLERLWDRRGDLYVAIAGELRLGVEWSADPGSPDDALRRYINRLELLVPAVDAFADKDVRESFYGIIGALIEARVYSGSFNNSQNDNVKRAITRAYKASEVLIDSVRQALRADLGSGPRPAGDRGREDRVSVDET